MKAWDRIRFAVHFVGIVSGSVLEAWRLRERATARTSGVSLKEASHEASGVMLGPAVGAGSRESFNRGIA